MILDERNEFADATAINTGGAGSYLVGDVIDLGLPAKDIGDGEELQFVIQVTTALASGTGSVSFGLMSHTAATIVGGTMHVQTFAGLQAAWPLGTAVALSLPVGVLYQRYLGVVQVVTIAAFTGGAINAFLTKDYAKFRAYPDAAQV